MAQTSRFPLGDYTPFGYLRNPRHRASSWTACTGGNLRTADELLGLEWVYPWHRQPDAGAGLSIVGYEGAQPLVSRDDFAARGLQCRYHSALILGFSWMQGTVQMEARFFLAESVDALCVRVRARNTAEQTSVVRCGFHLRAWGVDRDESLDTTLPHEKIPAHALVTGDCVATGPGPGEEARAGGGAVTATLPPGATVIWLAALGRGETSEDAQANARAALATIEASYRAQRAEDAHFYASCPVLEGDWPSGWQQGLVYDFETTRLLVLPPQGIFSDIWPSWMAALPRTVLAEGTLDMLRLAYADPEQAQRALLTMFRDAPPPNLPCVFANGSFNMVARDGSPCGTSPAWCLPFLNLELLYLRTLDRTWLEALYPYLATYLEWWRTQRTDAEGWVVYQCTWESGEDGNPRLDPTGSGDGVISHRIRPAELQATVAHAAGVLAFFAGEIGRLRERESWRRVQVIYRRRLQRLWDDAAGRYRDWLVQEDGFQDDGPGPLYWGINPRRESVLSLTPLLGLVSATRARQMEAEVRLHAHPPWTLWPSWCYVLVECAAAHGLHTLAGEVSYQVLSRVYPRNDRRSLVPDPRPTPGVAAEYWPEDLAGWAASDAYGWGATTANLLLRHVVGLQASRDTRHWTLRLVPALPPGLWSAGTLRVRRFLYRGMLLNLTYEPQADGSLRVVLDLDVPRRCSVLQANHALYRSGAASTQHLFHLANGVAYDVRLTP